MKIVSTTTELNIFENTPPVGGDDSELEVIDVEGSQYTWMKPMLVSKRTTTIPFCEHTTIVDNGDRIRTQLVAAGKSESIVHSATWTPTFLKNVLPMTSRERT